MSELIVSGLGMASKKELVSIAQATIKERIDSGLYDPLQDFIYVKRIVEFGAALLDSLKKSAIKEAAKYEKGFTLSGAKVELYQNSSWDYSVDPTWSKVNEQVQKLSKWLEEHEKYLKTLQAPKAVPDEETGEVITYYPPVQKGKSGENIRISF